MIKIGHPSRIASALLLTIATSMPLHALAQPAHNSHASKDMPAAVSGSADMKAMMKRMNEEMASMPMSGDPDIDFAMMMRVHHLGAIDMAKTELRDGRNPQMRKLAQDVVMAQNREIALLDKFLATKGHATVKK